MNNDKSSQEQMSQAAAPTPQPEPVKQPSQPSAPAPQKDVEVPDYVLLANTRKKQ